MFLGDELIQIICQNDVEIFDEIGTILQYENNAKMEDFYMD